MAKQATRLGTTVILPKYRNAEMLMLEFFRHETVSIRPIDNDNAPDVLTVIIYMHVDILDELLIYINSNI